MPLALAVGCTTEGPPPQPGSDRALDPGTPVGSLGLPAERSAELAALESQLGALSTLRAGDLIARRATTFQGELGYDPTTAKNLDLIQASSLALSDHELDKLRAQGFVIVPRHQFPHMAYGYTSLYALDLPVYVSLDSILNAVHLSYDAILKGLEQEQLSKELTTMLGAARAQLARGVVRDARTAADLDLYFAVALSLLDGKAASPVQGASDNQVRLLFDAAQRADGIRGVTLFGVARDVDFSQFKPRGHYTDSEQLERYFRASMWLGRTEFRLIETQGDGTSPGSGRRS